MNNSFDDLPHNLEKLEALPWVYYAYGTHAYYDATTDTYYNRSGAVLRDPSEYDTHSEGYTPFGDE